MGKTSAVTAMEANELCKCKQKMRNGTLRCNSEELIARVGMDTYYYRNASRIPAVNSQEKRIQAGSGRAACFWGGGKNRGAERKANAGGGPAQMQHSHPAIIRLLGLSSRCCVV